MSTAVASLLSAISSVGIDRLRGGYSRPVYSDAETERRAWFIAEAISRGLDVETDRNGIIWAWWDLPSGNRRGAIVTGSHLDSVPGGGAFDGPLGVASALAAMDILRESDQQPKQALAIAVFPEEEGSRFGVACLGSRLLTGAISPERALALKDEDGVTFAERSRAAGIDPRWMGADPAALAQIGAFVELHVEQGRGLIDLEHPIAIGSAILGHGRWKIVISGHGNHAGSTLMTDRRDPMVAAGALIAQIPSLARVYPAARATVGRIQPYPGGTNVIASRVELWLDVRHPDDQITSVLVQEIQQRAAELAAEQGCEVCISEESLSPTVSFDSALQRRLQGVLGDVPVLDTGAGHDAGVLAAHVPSAMLFVRNPSGISHSHEEHVEDSDAELGAAALARVLQNGLSQHPA